MMWDNGEYFSTSFKIHKWRRYHSKRAEFYRRIHAWAAIVNIVSASGAFVLFQSSLPNLASGLSATVAVVSTLELLMKPERLAEAHFSMCKKFNLLAAKIETLQPLPKHLKSVRAMQLQIESDTPLVDRTLVEIISHIEEARSRGVVEAELPPLTAHQRRFAHIATFGLSRIDKWKAEKEELSYVTSSTVEVVQRLPSL